MRRVMRTIVWGAAGAVPGLIMLAIPGFVESQAENLLLGVGGFLLAIVGAVLAPLPAGSRSGKRAGASPPERSRVCWSEPSSSS